MTLNKWWNLSGCRKLALSESWTNGIISYLVRAFKQGFSGCRFKSHSGQLSIAGSENPSVANTIYISWFSNTRVITYRKLWLNKRCNWRKPTAEMKFDTEQIMKLDWQYKVGSECELNIWPNSSVCKSVWKRFTGCCFKCNSGQRSKTSSENPSVVNINLISSFCYTRVNTYRKLRLMKRGEWQRQTAKMKYDTE